MPINAPNESSLGWPIAKTPQPSSQLCPTRSFMITSMLIDTPVNKLGGWPKAALVSTAVFAEFTSISCLLACLLSLASIYSLPPVRLTGILVSLRGGTTPGPQYQAHQP